VGAGVKCFEREFDEAWRVDIDQIERLMTPTTRMVALTSPHNPTGVVADAGTLRALGDLAATRGAVVLIDEAYSRDPASAAAKVHPACVSTGSLTKSYGLAGLRCGWAIASPEAAERIRRARDVVDAVGVYAAEVASARAFDHVDFLAARARGIVEPNVARVRAFVEGRVDLEWVAPAGGTVAFPRVKGMADTTALAERLLRDHDTAVVPGRFFGAPEHIRIAYGVAPDTLAAGLERIGAVLDAS
jgi:aspartate/methionine/tyrosine aminotransferase